MVGIAETRDRICVRTVMRQIACGLLVAATMQLVGVVAEHLSLAFDVVEHADLMPGKLHNPDCTGIGLGSCPANVPEQFNRNERVAREFAEPSLAAGVG